MDRNSIRSQIQDILRDILDNQSIIINEKTTSTEVKGWDSLIHIQLIVAIENHFGMKFSSIEIIQAKNIKELVNIVYQKIM